MRFAEEKPRLPACPLIRATRSGVVFLPNAAFLSPANPSASFLPTRSVAQVDGQVVALLVQNLERLDEGVKEEADGVHNTLGKEMSPPHTSSWALWAREGWVGA